MMDCINCAVLHLNLKLVLVQVYDLVPDLSSPTLLWFGPNWVHV